VALWLVWRFRPLDRALVRVIERLLRRYTDLDTHDYAALLRLSGDWTVRQIPIRPGGVLAGRALEEVTDAVVLGIERADGSYVGAPSTGTVLEPGDTLTVYGRNELLDRLGGTVSD
jgi:Trk K+ transport system NAD-binding subunit